VKRSYDSTAKIYDSRYAEEQKAKYEAALVGISLKGRILDVGCGTGLLFNKISKVSNVVGVDISKKLLLQAKKSSKTIDNLDLIQADADHLPFKEGEFDVVFAFTVLQNMPSPLETLREICRIVKSGSFVTVTGLKKVFTNENLKELLRNAGLQVASVVDDEKLKCYVALSRK
jgi:ubiquinone/menaquinone biosynthesis C-methylase UbiE